MKSYAKKVYVFMCASAILVGGVNVAQAMSVEEYNEQLPVWGVSWTGGNGALNGYYPSFYTGFIPRVQEPNRIHIRVSRGNQTRVSLILDEQTVYDYLYDLKTRKDFYNKLVADKYIDVSPSKAVVFPHLENFNAVLNSGVLNAVEDFDARKITKEQLYAESLKALKQLNSARTFDVRIDLAREFLKWRDENVSTVNSGIAKSSTQEAMVLVNKMLMGRINLTRKLNNAELSQLSNLIDQATVLSDEGFVKATYALFESVTDGKYDIRTLADNGQLVDAKSCNSLNDCSLSYVEVTTIYPTGSLEGTTSDKYKHKINQFATAGLANFTDGGSRSAVDNIRSEPYYGFAPKMDYEGVGNGFHNPAVRLWPNSSQKKALNIPGSHAAFWSVKRGGVSHGCLRLPIGHVWELRQSMPVENDKMKKVFWFGNSSADFDIYDLTGEGNPVAVGVTYYITYSLKGSSGLDKREGQGLEASVDLIDYYSKLFGKNVFDKSGLRIINPSISIQTVEDYFTERSRGRVKTSYTVEGSFPLYEQNYEKDKIQMFTSNKIKGFNSGLNGGGSRSLSKRFVRLIGRTKGCAPFSNQEACGGKAFESEKQQILAEIR
ncbi:MAG: hypothetical protein M9899_00130 [Bdellovibrionaceae bacterium]|nr:hypothetical protein [Pseudobdellovibrionaceae bacterium]